MHNNYYEVKHAFIVCLCITLASCHINSNKDKGEIQYVSEEYIEEIDIDELSATYSSVSFIPLEINASCIMGDTKKVVEYKSDFYVLAQGDGGRLQLFRFDAKGKFLKKFSSYGNASNEYNLVSTFFIQNDKVYLIDTNKRRILEFSLDGKFQGMKEVGDGIMFVRDALETENKQILMVNGINFGEKHVLYLLYNPENGNIQNFQTTKYTFGGMMEFSLYPMTKCGREVLFCKPLEKSIYGLDGEERMRVTYRGEMTEPTATDYTEAKKEISRDISQIYAIHGTRNRMLINLGSGAVLWDMNSHHGVFCKNGIDFSEVSVFPFNPINICASDESRFFSLWKADNFINACKSMTGRNVRNMPPDSIISRVNNESNPVLVIYQMKYNE